MSDSCLLAFSSACSAGPPVKHAYRSDTIRAADQSGDAGGTGHAGTL